MQNETVEMKSAGRRSDPKSFSHGGGAVFGNELRERVETGVGPDVYRSEQRFAIGGGYQWKISWPLAANSQFAGSSSL